MNLLLFVSLLMPYSLLQASDLRLLKPTEEQWAKLPQEEAKEQAERIQRELLEDRKQDEADEKKIKKFMKEELSFPEEESAAGMEKVPSDSLDEEEPSKSE